VSDAGSPFRSPAGRVPLWLATGFGSGYSPVAPGTAGTLVALPFGWLLWSLGPAAQIVVILLATAVAIWSAGIAAPAFGLKDPGQIVVDEIVGLLVTVALLPAGWVTLAAGFLAFRVFDVVKPPPCRNLERLPGGVGIVADDLMAGLYANLTLRILCAAGILSL
jgi:phosphatidylglycerophosphatase A